MLQLPACLLSVFVMYWSLPIGCLLYRIRFLDVFSSERADIFNWSALMMDWFKARVYKVGEHSLHKGNGPVVYLCNHRSWADFFIDKYLTEAEGAPLSRWAVFYAFPVFITAALWMRHMIFFKRIRLADKEAFNRRLEAQFQRTYTNGMIVYPEGHRSTKAESLPLKRGILHFTYSRGYKTQVIITRGKEQLLSEKRLAVHFGARLACGYGAVIDPAAHSDFDAFVAEVQRQWDALWQQVYGADVEALPELQVGVGGSASQTFPRGVLLGQAAICTASIVLFAAMLWAAARVIAASAWTMTGAAVLAGWTAVAMSRAELKPGEGL